MKKLLLLLLFVTSVQAQTLVPCRNGGTGLSSYAVGDLIYASGSCTLSKLADVATGNVLISGGVTTAPLWSTVTGITGTGALNAGSITSGFGSIDVGSDAISGGAGSFTTGAFSGLVTSTVSSKALQFSGATTGNSYMRFDNSGGSLLMGLESSAGGTIITGGTADSTVLTSGGATSLHLGTSDTVRFTINSSGAVSMTGLTTTGAASGKKVVCVDTATGILYASSTGTDCSN